MVLVSCRPINTIVLVGLIVMVTPFLHAGSKCATLPGMEESMTTTSDFITALFYPYNATFFSPLFLGAYDVQDTPGDCAVGARPQRRNSPQSYTHKKATRLRI